MAVLVCLVLAGGAQTASAGKQGLGPADLGYIFTKDLKTGAGELIQFDNRTNGVLRRMLEPATVAPELLMTPEGHELFMLGGSLSNGGKTLAHTLSIVDTRSGSPLWTTPVTHRMQYIGPGPGTMALSPSAMTLYVYSYDVPAGKGADYARYWLTVEHLDTHTVSAKRIALAGCGPARFVTAKRWIVALCDDTNDLRFVDPLAFKVVARVRLPAFMWHGAAALDVPRSQDRLYIVTVDQRFVVIDVRTHRITRIVTAYRQESGTVSGLYSTAISSDDRELIVGSMAQPHDTSSPLILRAFAIPSLKLMRGAKFSQFFHVVAAPNDGLYAFPMGDSPDIDWKVQYLNSDLSPSPSTISLKGPVFQLVVPNDAFVNNG
jgi:hypothetical protein